MAKKLKFKSIHLTKKEIIKPKARIFILKIFLWNLTKSKLKNLSMTNLLHLVKSFRKESTKILKLKNFMLLWHLKMLLVLKKLCKIWINIKSLVLKKMDCMSEMLNQKSKENKYFKKDPWIKKLICTWKILKILLLANNLKRQWNNLEKSLIFV